MGWPWNRNTGYECSSPTSVRHLKQPTVNTWELKLSNVNWSCPTCLLEQHFCQGSVRIPAGKLLLHLAAVRILRGPTLLPTLTIHPSSINWRGLYTLHMWECIKRLILDVFFYACKHISRILPESLTVTVSLLLYATYASGLSNNFSEPSSTMNTWLLLLLNVERQRYTLAHKNLINSVFWLYSVCALTILIKSAEPEIGRLIPILPCKNLWSWSETLMKADF